MDNITLREIYNCVLLIAGIGLQGLKEQGCNGPVTQAIDDINDYLQTKINS